VEQIAGNAVSQAVMRMNAVVVHDKFHRTLQVL
jgi:hypothetical protein